MLQSAHRRRELIIDDVAQVPLSSTPERRKFPTDGPRIVTEARPQVGEVLLDGRCILHAGGFGQNANGSVIVLVGASRSPRVVNRVRRNPGLPFPDETIHHGLADKGSTLNEDRIDVRLVRIHERRNK